MRSNTMENAVHQISIPDHIVRRAREQRGGREHLFDELDLSRTAHIIVDLQNGFVREGAPVEVPFTREIVPHVNAISRAVRAAGGVNAFLRFTYDEGETLPWQSFYRDYATPEQLAVSKAAFTRGALDFELWPGLDVQDGDLIVDKTRFSGFIPGTSELHDLLQAHEIDTLIITGTLTNCCCESSARDAMQMGYKIIFVSDANATLSDEEHNATLISMTTIFADVMDTNHLLGVIEASTAPEVRTAAQ
jgi:ureidoacrylate peracid hydrolase